MANASVALALVATQDSAFILIGEGPLTLRRYGERGKSGGRWGRFGLSLGIRCDCVQHATGELLSVLLLARAFRHGLMMLGKVTRGRVVP